jgi:tetratricopeptide (TPR) repeat protein
MKKHIIAKLLILLLLCISTIGCDKTSSKNIELIKAGKYEEAAIWLYEENMTLYNYCHAKINYDKGNYRLGKSYLDDILNTYSGPLNEEVISYKREMEDKNVEFGFDEIHNNNYEEAAQWFYELSKEDENMFMLYNYAQSLQYYEEGDFVMAKANAEELDSYTGYGEQEVKDYRTKTLNEITPEIIADQRAKEKTKAKSEGVRIGMTEREVRESSWGDPIKINRTITEYGTHEQWVYDNYNYLYFKNGILTTIQN